MEQDPSSFSSTSYEVDCSPLLAEAAGGSFALDPFTVEDQRGEDRFQGNVRIRIDRTNRGVRIVGEVLGTQSGGCGRCLAPTSVSLRAPIDEEAVEAAHADEGLLRIGKGNLVDVGRIALETLDLSRRLVLRCEPPCPERCGLCGEGHPAEACPERGLDPRMAGLAALLSEDGDDGAPIG